MHFQIKKQPPCFATRESISICCFHFYYAKCIELLLRFFIRRSYLQGKSLRIKSYPQGPCLSTDVYVCVCVCVCVCLCLCGCESVCGVWRYVLCGVVVLTLYCKYHISLCVCLHQHFSQSRSTYFSKKYVTEIDLFDSSFFS